MISRPEIRKINLNLTPVQLKQSYIMSQLNILLKKCIFIGLKFDEKRKLKFI